MISIGILFLYLQLGVGFGQVLLPVGACMGACRTCHPQELTKCIGTQPCEEGYLEVNNHNQISCQQRPSFIYQTELSERASTSNATLPSEPVNSNNWLGSASNIIFSTCSYQNTANAINFIDVLGFYQGISTISRNYTLSIDSTQSIMLLSFDLIRDQWLPFQDFLIVNVKNRKNQIIHTEEITFKSKTNISALPYHINCDENALIIEKYVIKIALTSNISLADGQIIVSWSSFLEAGKWGLSNIKLIEGCNVKTSIFDTQAQQCILLPAFNQANPSNITLTTSLLSPNLNTSNSTPSKSDTNTLFYSIIPLSVPLINNFVILNTSKSQLGLQNAINLNNSSITLTNQTIKNQTSTTQFRAMTNTTTAKTVTNNIANTTTNTRSSVKNDTAIMNASSINTEIKTNISKNNSSPGTSITKMSYIPFNLEDDGSSGLQILLESEPCIKENQYFYVLIDDMKSDKVSLLKQVNIADNLLLLQISISESFVNKNLKIYSIPAVDFVQLSSSQTSFRSQPLATVLISRYDDISSEMQSISAFGSIFTCLSWLVLISIISLTFLGHSIVLQQLVITMQIIYLHVYVAPQSLPLSFRDVIAGMANIINLNYFIPSNRKAIQQSWLGNVVQSTPLKFMDYQKVDINFSRAFFAIIIINIVFMLWFVVLKILRKYVFQSCSGQEKLTNYNILQRLFTKLVNRSFNYCDSIWRYQFLSTIWLCSLQFYNLKYPSESNRNATINAIVCILSFIVSLLWPLAMLFYTRKSYYQCQYTAFRSTFQDTYYLQIPHHFLPSTHQRVGFPLVRIFKIITIVIVMAYFSDYPYFALPLCISIYALELFYIYFQDIFVNRLYFKCKIAEGVFIILMEITLIIICMANSTLSKNSIVGLGYFCSALALFAVMVGFLRAGYLIFLKYQSLEGENEEEKYIQEIQNKLPTERVV